jgi:hypothetical protein
MPGSCLWCGQPTDGIDVYCSRACESDHDLTKDEGMDPQKYPSSCFPEDDGLYDTWQSEDMYNCG